MKNKISNPAVKRLRIRAMGMWILSGLLAVLVIGSVCVYRNPWITHRLVAQETTPMLLEEIRESRSPYVKFDGINLSFTGYYKALDGSEVVAYCFKGQIAGANIFVELPARELGDLLGPDDEAVILENYPLAGQLVDGTDMIAAVAATEDMSPQSYETANRLAETVVHAYGSNQERVRIIQLIMILLAIGALAAGWILWAESRVVEREEA